MAPEKKNSLGARLAAFLLFFAAASAYAQAPDDLRNRRLPTPGEAHTLVSKPVKVPADQVPLKVPEGFRVDLLMEGMHGPREIVQLPSRDLLVADTPASVVWRIPINEDGTPGLLQTWLRYLRKPYGIAYHDGSVYIAETDAVRRYPPLPNGTAGEISYAIRPIAYDGKPLRGGNHSTRDLLFSRDGKRMFLSVGSQSNSRGDEPTGHAAIWEYDVGKWADPRLYATGLRNPVSLAWRPGSEELWTTVNERDGLGNDLVPDYVTHVQRGAFYGWPFFYLGPHEDPRHAGKRPDLAAKVTIPDILIQSHSAPLGLTFYEGKQFPAHYQGGLFVALHGSWNRDPLVGYQVVFVPFKGGKPAGDPEPFLTGFIKDAKSGEVYGRPVTPYVLSDGSLVVSDDGGGRLWRIRYRPGADH